MAAERGRPALTSPEHQTPILIKSSSAQLGGASSSSGGPPSQTEEVAVQILVVNFNLDGLS